MPDVDVEVEAPPPLEDDEGGGDSFMVNAWIHPPGSAPMVSASAGLPADAAVDDIASAMIRVITAAAQAHSSDLVMALQYQLFSGGR